MKDEYGRTVQTVLLAYSKKPMLVPGEALVFAKGGFPIGRSQIQIGMVAERLRRTGSDKFAWY
jgi:hypothetical protein